MSKSRPFSIFLLKEGYDARNALRDGHALEVDVDASALPADASLFILDAPPKRPWWKDYFGVQKDLWQTGKGALVFLPVGARTFALSFGHVSHNLKDASYEYDFGLRVTLNCVDPKKLKNTDALEPGAARRQRTQVSVDSDLTYFDFDRDSKILKSLTGKAKAEHQALIKHATGASNLRINSPVPPAELTALCERLLELYADEGYRDTFPDIQNITPVRDPAIVEQLDEKLIEAFRTKSQDLYLAVPALIDYQDNVYARFSGVGPSLIYDDVFLARYYEYLESHDRNPADLGLEDLKKHALRLTNEDGDTRDSFSILRSLVFDTMLEDSEDSYHLIEGNWYRVAKSYVVKLAEFLDPLCVEMELPPYNESSEAAYNSSVAAGNAAYVCLDKSNISPPGETQVEPCDLYSVVDGCAFFYHVKVSTFSAQLSHLFNQGTNAIELLKLDDEAREKLRALIADKASADGVAALLAPIEGMKVKIVFAIVTHKDVNEKSGNLPLFSRVSLMRCLRALRLMSVPAFYGYVADQSPRTEGKKKKRKKAKSADEGVP